MRELAQLRPLAQYRTYVLFGQADWVEQASVTGRARQAVHDGAGVPTSDGPGASRRFSPLPRDSSGVDSSPVESSRRRARQSLARIPAQPPMNGLARHAIATSYVSHAGAVVEHLEHRPIPLFHEPQLHQHGSGPLRRGRVRPQRRRPEPAGRGCSDVVEMAEPVSPTYRSFTRYSRGIRTLARGIDAGWAPLRGR